MECLDGWVRIIAECERIKCGQPLTLDKVNILPDNHGWVNVSPVLLIQGHSLPFDAVQNTIFFCKIGITNYIKAYKEYPSNSDVFFRKVRIDEVI